MKTFVLWGTKKGAPKWAEDIIVETKEKSVLEKAKVWAKENDFENLRVQEHNEGDKPDFAGTIKK